MFKYALILILTIFIPVNAYSMQVSIADHGDFGYGMELKGKIEPGDYQKIIKRIKKEEQLPAYVNITSAGGNVIEGMMIGLLFRDSLTDLTAFDNCASSCFFIWAAAPERNALPRNLNELTPDEIESSKLIGLHRPYYEQSYFSGLSATQAREQYKELDNVVRNYLSEMSIKREWVDMMFQYASDDVRYVTYRELSLDFGFSSPWYEEWIKASCPISDEDKSEGEINFYVVVTGTKKPSELNADQRKKFDAYTEYSDCKITVRENSRKETLQLILNDKYKAEPLEVFK